MGYLLKYMYNLGLLEDKDLRGSVETLVLDSIIKHLELTGRPLDLKLLQIKRC